MKKCLFLLFVVNTLFAWNEEYRNDLGVNKNWTNIPGQIIVEEVLDKNFVICHLEADYVYYESKTTYHGRSKRFVVEVPDTSQLTDESILPSNISICYGNGCNLWNSSTSYKLIPNGVYFDNRFTIKSQYIKFKIVYETKPGYFYKDEEISKETFEKLYQKYSKYIRITGNLYTNHVGFKNVRSPEDCNGKLLTKEEFRKYLNFGGKLFKYDNKTKKYICGECNGRGTIHGEEQKGKLGRPIITCPTCKGKKQIEHKRNDIKEVKVK